MVEIIVTVNFRLETQLKTTNAPPPLNQTLVKDLLVDQRARTNMF